MVDIRIFFHKTGVAKYISHLDLNRCFQRAIKRAELPVWYTQGFNPHIYLTFSLPISLGFESLCESCDLRLTQELTADEVMGRLNGVLPRGLHVYGVAPPAHKHTEISSAVYEISIYKNTNVDGLVGTIKRELSADNIIVEKKSKKGIAEIDLKAQFDGYQIEDSGECVKLTIKLPAGTVNNINPELLIDYLVKKANGGIDSVSILRKSLLLQNGEIFE